jgi:tRNA-intron endonuclease
MIRLELVSKKQIRVTQPESISSLQNGFYGTMKRGVIYLSPEEALYIMDIRNGRCYDESGNEYSFNAIASLFKKKDRKLLSRYLTYKDWRDKGLVVRDISEAEGSYGRTSLNVYESSDMGIAKFSFGGLFFKGDLLTVVDDSTVGKELYEQYWLGQYGTYKSAHRGRVSKLDVYETLFLGKYGGLRLSDATFEQVKSEAKKRIKFFEDIYSVYEDWRKRGYVVKTGFKFGTHFRIYFPGASPKKEDKVWVHSKHVIHVFSRKDKLLISEWARAIRVAHSVKKTFILAIPGTTKKSKRKAKLDFLLYHRTKGGIETPKDGSPRFLMFSLSEDVYLGGEELARALSKCDESGLEMVMAISDRESSVTYYLIKRIGLPGSKYDYFEIEWIQP